MRQVNMRQSETGLPEFWQIVQDLEESKLRRRGLATPQALAELQRNVAAQYAKTKARYSTAGGVG